jgi:hypothetical protein
MATLPHHLTEKIIADLPWLNDAKGAIAPRLDVTGHPAQDIAKLRDALYAENIATKQISAGNTTYVVAAVDVPGVDNHLETIRIKHLPLEDANGATVNSHQQFNSHDPLSRVDNKFIDLHPEAEAGARIENPAALKSLQDVLKHAGYYGNDIVNGELKVLASGSNSDMFQSAGKFKGELDVNSLKHVGVNTITETPSFKQAAETVINSNRLNVSLGALIITADAALAAAPALSEGKYADAGLLALNSTARLATEVVIIAECTSEVAAAAAPLLADPPIYAAAVTAGAGVCASGMNNIMTYGEKGMEAIEARVKEVAASNGLDPDHIWTSMLQRTKEESTTPVEKQPAYEP